MFCSVPEKKTGLLRVYRALGYSWQGLRYAWKHEAAFRQEVLMCMVLVPLGLWLGHDWVERILLSGSGVLVLVCELLNSAIEAIVDLVSLENHPLAGAAKDLGSAAVLLCLLIVSFVWIVFIIQGL